MATFLPEQKALIDLFTKRNYIIPPYQRPYSWDCVGKTDKNNQITAIWRDLFDAHEAAPNEIYFLGSMVVIEIGSNRTFQVVDGQQRLTTLILLFSAIKCFLKGALLNNIVDTKINTERLQNTIARIDRIIFDMEEADDADNPLIKKLIIDKSTYETFDYDIYLRKAMECTAWNDVVFDKSACHIAL